MYSIVIVYATYCQKMSSKVFREKLFVRMIRGAKMGRLSSFI